MSVTPPPSWEAPIRCQRGILTAGSAGPNCYWCGTHVPSWGMHACEGVMVDTELRASDMAGGFEEWWLGLDGPKWWRTLLTQRLRRAAFDGELDQVAQRWHDDMGQWARNRNRPAVKSWRATLELLVDRMEREGTAQELPPAPEALREHYPLVACAWRLRCGVAERNGGRAGELARVLRVDLFEQLQLPTMAAQ